MIIFLFGKDSYRSNQKLKEIISRYQKIHKSGLNFLKFQAGDFDLLRFQDQAQSVSMFAEKKLVACYNLLQELNQGLQEKLLAFLKSAKLKDRPEVILVFYESDLPDKTLRLFQFLKRKPNHWQKFDELAGAALESWIKDEASRQGAKIDFMAVKKLAANVGSDLWRMHNEISKLTTYSGSNKTVWSADIDLLVETKFEPNIFKTIDALAGKNKKTALRLLYQHLQSGEDPLYLLSMFIYQWRNLLQIKDLLTRRLPYYVLAKKTKLHPFVIRKTYQLARRFSLEQLKENYQYWQQLDYQVKTGQIDAKEALTTAVLSV